MTRSQRIHRGFHRIGVVVVLIALVLAIINLPSVLQNPLGQNVFGLVGMGFLYGIARAIGWILAGFIGD
jgi:hypothetical protein